MNPQYLLLLVSVLFLSCEKPDTRPLEIKTGRSTAQANPRLLDDGAVDGGAWTLAQFSDFFDKDITIEKVKNTFGANPLIQSDGNNVTFVYAVGSERMFEYGSRIHTISIHFNGEEFMNVEIGFTNISD